MADSLRVDTSALTAAGTSLDAVADEFATANATARELRCAIGHDGLADQVAGFAMGWDEIRIGMVKDITFLGEACTRIGTTLEALDRELATGGTTP